MFALKRPCVSCPFRRGQGSTFRLGAARLDEIVHASAFQCHKTVDYDEDATSRAGDRPQQCAGLMAVLYRSDRTNQIMQVAQRLSGFDPASVDPDGEAYASIEEALAAHAGVEPWKTFLPSLCGECATRTVLTTGKIVYPHRRDLFGKLFYRCSKCGASCGVHAGTERPLGRPAGPDTKRARVAAHAAFDPLWQAKVAREGCSRTKARGAGYKWLAEQMGMTRRECHISMMDAAQAWRVVEICRRRGK